MEAMDLDDPYGGLRAWWPLHLSQACLDPEGTYDNLIYDQELTFHNRWFNRRGDQLWCNDGRYKAAVQEYPRHLRDYPDVGEGEASQVSCCDFY